MTTGAGHTIDRHGVESTHAMWNHPTRALIHLDRLGRNVRLLQELVGKRQLWPAIKANAYGHGAEIVARHLVRTRGSANTRATVTS